MGIFSFFRSKQSPPSASLAKERLQVLIAHERVDDRDGPDYLPLLKQDILDVIKKYVEIGEDQVSVQLDSQENCDVLELNITLPDELDNTQKQNLDKVKAKAKRRARPPVTTL